VEPQKPFRNTSIRVDYSETDTYNPHVCFGCTNTSKTAIKKAWEEFKNKYFEASFIGSKISLIKTTQMGYEIAAQFELE
jgi:2'-5' RNA ligase